MVQPLRSGEVSQLSPKLGGPCEETSGSPCLSSTRIWATTWPSAALTPSTASMVGTSEPSMRVRSEPNGVSTLVLERTTTSMEA